jgi:hypothetical protein
MTLLLFLKIGDVDVNTAPTTVGTGSTPPSGSGGSDRRFSSGIVAVLHKRAISLGVTEYKESLNRDFLIDAASFASITCALIEP